MEHTVCVTRTAVLCDSALSGVYLLAHEFAISQWKCANDVPDATDAKAHTKHTTA